MTSSESPTPVTSERTSSTGATGVGATVRMRPDRRNQRPHDEEAISSITTSSLSSGRRLGMTISCRPAPIPTCLLLQPEDVHALLEDDVDRNPLRLESARSVSTVGESFMRWSMNRLTPS